MSPIDLGKISSIGTFFTGLAVLMLSGIFLSMGLRTAQPLNGAYGDQAILAFELADTPEELAAVIGPNPPDAEAVAIRSLMDRANKLDFTYAGVYAAFIAFACACAARRRGHRWLRLGVALGPLAGAFDLGENIVLLELTKPDVDPAPLLPPLHVCTLIKWQLLAVASALFAAGFLGDRRRWVGVVAGAAALLALAGGVLTLVDAAKFLGSLSAAIASVWLWQLGYGAAAMFREL